MKSTLLAFILAVASAAPAAAQFGGAAGIAEGEALFAQAQSDREPGAVYVYRDTGDGWTQVAKLTASDGAAKSLIISAATRPAEASSISAITTLALA